MENQNIIVSLDTISKVRGFVNAVSHLDGEFDLVSGRYRVDAKSIMGIFSLDLSKPLNLEVNGQTDMASVKNTLKDYVVS